MSDTNFEAMSNPDKFPIGDGCFGTDRPRKLIYRKYFNQRLLDVDGRFAKDIDYLFVAQYIVEAKQVVMMPLILSGGKSQGENSTPQQYITNGRRGRTPPLIIPVSRRSSQALLLAQQ